MKCKPLVTSPAKRKEMIKLIVNEWLALFLVLDSNNLIVESVFPEFLQTTQKFTVILVGTDPFLRFLKVTVYLQRCLASKRCSAPALNCRYLNLYITLKLIELAIKLDQEF